MSDVINADENLMHVISFNQFDFSKYREHERDILQPQMEELGFKDIKFGMGEQDSFGPLTRTVHCIDKDGKNRHFFYG